MNYDPDAQFLADPIADLIHKALVQAIRAGMHDEPVDLIEVATKTADEIKLVVATELSTLVKSFTERN